VEDANHDVDGLVEALTAAYKSFEPMRLNCLFLTLPGILEEVTNRQGDNDYDIPHMGKKAALERQGILPVRLDASDEAIELASTSIDELDGDGEDID
jgi:hypothetical protein